MLITIEVTEGGIATRSATKDAAGAAPLHEAILQFAHELGIEPAELLDDLGVNGTRFQPHDTVDTCVQHGHHWHHHRVCIDLHFETEIARHHFPASAKWSLVHRWGCQRFQVASDARPNLELHDGTIDGPALNDDKEIGRFDGCKKVWLVKPGPEPNGTRSQTGR